jgi:hypothetical protein
MSTPDTIPHFIEIVQGPAAVILEFLETIADRHLLPNLPLRIPEGVVNDYLGEWDGQQ